MESTKDRSDEVQRYAARQLATVMAGVMSYMYPGSVEDIYLDVEHIDRECGHADHRVRVVIEFAEGYSDDDYYDAPYLMAYLADRLNCLLELRTPIGEEFECVGFSPRDRIAGWWTKHDAQRDRVALLIGRGEDFRSLAEGWRNVATYSRTATREPANA